MTKNKIPVKVGIIGCGNIAKVHLRLLLKYVDKNAIAICDTDELRLNDFSLKMGIKSVYKDVQTMLDEFKPSEVHITTPPSTHKDIAILCMEFGCRVLIEKPMCVSIKDADEIVRYAKQNNKLVCIDHMRVFDPLTIQAKEILNSKKLGKITNISVGYSYDYLTRVSTDAAARWIGNLPGGSFFDLMPHLLCLLDDFLPDLRLERSFVKKNFSGIVTDLACIFSSSAGTGMLHMSLEVYPLKNYVEFECTNGTLRIDFRNFLVLVRKKYGLPNAIDRIVQNLSLGFQMILGSSTSIFKFVLGKLDPYAGLEYIIAKFLTSEESPVPPEKGRELLQLAEQIFSDEETSTKAEFKKSFTDIPYADVLVTGGTGFIGRRLVNRLLKSGHKVRILSHRDLNENELKSSFEGSVNIIVGDVYNYQSVEKACTGIKTIYHLAAAMKGDWNYHLDTTITGTQNILTNASNLGVEHLVYVSTLNVYNAKQYPHNRIIDESFSYEDQPEKRGAYSNAKLKAEKLVLDFASKSKMTISVLRPGLVYGPGGQLFPRDVGFRIGKHMVLVFGLGFRRLPLVYVDNLIDALVVMGENVENANDIFNLVDKEFPTQREFIRIYRKLTNEKFFVIYLPFWFVFTGIWIAENMINLFFKKSISLSYKLRCVSKSPLHSTERIQNQLGWNQTINFIEGIKRTLSKK